MSSPLRAKWNKKLHERIKEAETHLEHLKSVDDYSSYLSHLSDNERSERIKRTKSYLERLKSELNNDDDIILYVEDFRLKLKSILIFLIIIAVLLIPIVIISIQLLKVLSNMQNNAGFDIW